MPRNLMVREIMSTDLVTLTEDETLADAQRCMRQGRIRHMPVLSGRRLVGLLTHRDLLAASFSIFAEVDSTNQRRIFGSVVVADAMHRDLVTIAPDVLVAEAAMILLDNKYGCLPVVGDNAHLLGIVTEADFLRLTVQLLS